MNAGNINEGARLALYFLRQAPKVKSAIGLLADKALLSVTQTALGLPASMSNLSIDAQAKLIKDKFDVADLRDSIKLDKFLKKFMARWDVDNSTSNTGAVGASLLGSGGAAISPDLMAAIQKLQLGS